MFTMVYILLLDCSLHHYVVFFVFHCRLGFNLFCQTQALLLQPSFHFHEISFSIPLLLVCVHLYLRWVSWRQHKYWSCVLIHSATLCLLVGAFQPCTFKVIIDGYVLSAILLLDYILLVFFSFSFSFS